MIYLICISRKQKTSCPNSGRNDAVRYSAIYLGGVIPDPDAKNLLKV